MRAFTLCYRKKLRNIEAKNWHLLFSQLPHRIILSDVSVFSLSINVLKFYNQLGICLASQRSKGVV